MDKKYWEEFYQTQNKELKPSLFARYVWGNIIENHKTLIELGCGNGRDAVYFANEGITVHAIDQCENEIKFLANRYKYMPNISFETGDFSEANEGQKYDVIYSRFTLHSISKKQEEKTLKWAYTALNEDGVFCIEVRGLKNEIYQFGEKVEEEDNAFIYDNHFRRFIDFETFCNDLQILGFFLEYAAEERGFAPFEGQDETYIRIIAKK